MSGADDWRPTARLEVLAARARVLAAIRGFFAEASVRGATPLWGSTWTYGGVNAALSFYVPMPLGLVLATRTRLKLFNPPYT